MRRLIDMIFSALCMVILSPIFLLLAVAILIESPGSIIFSQERVGKNKKPFCIFKFRSMRAHAESTQDLGRVKHDHEMVTRVGYFMRRTKLDEIPQFFNVFLGEMSIVGPRPCLFETLQTMSAYECRRFDVLPGVTGWAEVNGNVELSWPEQLMLDLWYIDHRSFYLDCLIIARTFLTLFIGSIKNKKALLIAECYQESHEK